MELLFPDFAKWGYLLRAIFNDKKSLTHLLLISRNGDKFSPFREIKKGHHESAKKLQVAVFLHSRDFPFLFREMEKIYHNFAKWIFFISILRNREIYHFGSNTSND